MMDFQFVDILQLVELIFEKLICANNNDYYRRNCIFKSINSIPLQMSRSEIKVRCMKAMNEAGRVGTDDNAIQHGKNFYKLFVTQ